MLTSIIAELSILGYKYHDRKSDKYSNEDKKYAYHVYMMKLYTEILGKKLESDKLRDKYLK